jgi:hypothetical protein
MSAAHILERLTAPRCVRRTVDASFLRYARRRTAALDAQPARCCQAKTLLRLVRQAQHTRFGREHDFARVRTLRDYQASVPLRDYDTFWRDYWQPAFPHVQGATWPDAPPYFALSSGTTTGATKYIPVTRQMLSSNRRAALTALAWFRAAHPEAQLFTGRMFFLGGSTDLTPLAAPAQFPKCGDLSGIATEEAPAILRPYTFPPRELALLTDWEQKVQHLAEASASMPITLLGGVPSWLLVLFERLRQVSGKEHIAEIWPSLRLLVHGGTKFDPYRALFKQLIGCSDVHFLETYPASEGFIAAEDPRYGLLRLIPDHGVFFEFVPMEELANERPTRLTLGDIEIGVQYAVVLTTCAGLWSYVLGDTVCFERREPPLLRFTGRTRQFLSAFGEHLIGEEVERAVAEAAAATGATVSDFHVGPVFPEIAAAPGRHRYFVEFVQPPAAIGVFARELDAVLGRFNEDYRAHRIGDLALSAPEVQSVKRGGFASWLRSRGKLGGQHKVPRLDNAGTLTDDLARWFRSQALLLSDETPAAAFISFQ